MVQKGNFYRAYVKDPKTGKSIYLHKGPNDLGRSDIPKEDRADDFDRIWNCVFKQVMEYWDGEPVTDLNEFDRYEHVIVEEE